MIFGKPIACGPWRDWLKENWNWYGMKDPTHMIVVEIQFEVPSVNVKPFKTVKTEYLLTTFMSLVGNVGGTLGMFVGFSFIGMADWFTSFWGWINSRRFT